MTFFSHFSRRSLCNVILHISTKQHSHPKNISRKDISPPTPIADDTTRSQKGIILHSLLFNCWLVNQISLNFLILCSRNNSKGSLKLKYFLSFFLFSIVNTKSGRKTKYFPSRLLNRLKFSTKWFSLRNNWFKNIIFDLCLLEKNTSRGKHSGSAGRELLSRTLSNENQYFCYDSAVVLTRN